MTGYVGISTSNKSPFLADQAALSPILRDIAARGLLFLDAGLLDSNDFIANRFVAPRAERLLLACR